MTFKRALLTCSRYSSTEFVILLGCGKFKKVEPVLIKHGSIGFDFGDFSEFRPADAAKALMASCMAASTAQHQGGKKAFKLHKCARGL